MIRWKCACGHAGKTEEKNAGKRAKCPQCERVFRIPYPDNFEDEFDDEPDPDVSWNQPRAKSKAELKSKARRKANTTKKSEQNPVGTGSERKEGLPTIALIAGAAVLGVIVIGGLAYVLSGIVGTESEDLSENKVESSIPNVPESELPVVEEIVSVSDATEACYVRPAEADSEIQVWLPGTPTVSSVIADIGRGETPAKKWALDHELGRFEYICIRNPSAFRHEAMLGLARSTVKHLKDEFAALPPKVTRLSKYGTHGEQAVYSTADGREIVQYRVYGLGSTAHALVFRAADTDTPEPLMNPVVVKFFASLGRT